MSIRDFRIMREMLADVGIELEAPRTATCARPAARPAPPVDRDEVRRILVERGAPDEDLDWLVRSCTSLVDAHAYRPPPAFAWCPRCSNPVQVGPGGCVPCARAAAAAREPAEPAFNPEGHEHGSAGAP